MGMILRHQLSRKTKNAKIHNLLLTSVTSKHQRNVQLLLSTMTVITSCLLKNILNGVAFAAVITKLRVVVTILTDGIYGM